MATNANSSTTNSVWATGLKATKTSVAFIDSVGVNMHSGMSTNVPYAYRNPELVEKALQYLNVTHIRDGIGIGFSKAGYEYTTITENYLADKGYKFDFPISSLAPEYIDALRNFATKHPGAIESLEGPNEANSWNVDKLLSLQSSLYNFVHSDPAMKGVTVMNFTLAYTQNIHYLEKYGDLSSMTDEGNVHIYATYGRSPAAFWPQLALAQAATPGQQMNITETGYSTLSSNTQYGVDEAAQAKYILNMLMDAAEHNIGRTYLYELLDRTQPNATSPLQGYFGLFHADGTPKPAADAIHNLMTILDTGAQATSELRTLDVVFNQPLDPSVHKMVIQKSANTFDLVLWAEPNVWSSTQQKAIQAPTISVDLSFLGAKSAALFDPLTGTAALRVFDDPTASSIINVTDHPVIIEVTLKDAQGTPNDAEGNLPQPIVVSDVTTYVKGILAKEVITYANGGPEISNTKLFNSAGILTSETRLHADGSKDVYLSAISGKTYVAEHDVYDATGKQVEITRTHADSTLDYRYVLTSNGTKITDSYDATGKPKSHVEARSDGYLVTLTYKNGVPSSEVIRFAPGGAELTATKLYTLVDGVAVVARDTRVHADGSKDVFIFHTTDKPYTDEHNTYSGAGTLIHQTRTYAGHELQTYDLDGNGTKTTDTYDAAGLKTSHTEVRTSGYTATQTYKGGVLASETVKFPPGGPEISETKIYTNVDGQAVLSGVTQVHAGGTKDLYTTPADIAAAGYEAKHTAYNSMGKFISIDQTNLDGTHTQSALQIGVTLTSTSGVADFFKGVGGDTFAFAQGFGHDTVIGFHAGDGVNHDVLLLDQLQVHDFADLQARMHASGKDTLIDLGGGDSILLKNVAPTALTAADVHFQDFGLFHA